MNRVALGCAVSLLAVVLAAATDRTSMYTNPAPLSRETLDRLNLKQDWVAHVPMESRKDGIFSVQFPESDLVRFAPSGAILIPQIIVQTRSGLVVALSRDTGEIMWQNRAGDPYSALQPLAINSRTIVQTVGLDAHAFDRFTGEHQWVNHLPTGAVAAPLADDNQMYVVLAEGRLRVYQIPDMELYRDSLEAARRKEQTAKEQPPDKGSGSPSYPPRAAPNPFLSTGTVSTRELYLTEERGPKLMSVWNTVDIYHISGTPILTPTSWVVLGADGTAAAISRWEFKEGMRYRAGAALLLPPGSYESMAYVATENQKLLALNTEVGEPTWQYDNGNAVMQQPFVSDDDVFAIFDHKGLTRLDRARGEPQWKSFVANVDRVVATNPKFIYALDRQSRLVVLDRERGTELSKLDNRDFPVPIVNEHTDRVFLGSHDGTIVCLHDKDYVLPHIMKSATPDDGGKLNPLKGKLLKNVNVNEPLVNKPLREVLQYFETEFKLPTLVRKETFRDNAALEEFLKQPVTLEKNVNVPLDFVLGKLLEKVKAKYTVRAGYLLIEPIKDVKGS